VADSAGETRGQQKRIYLTPTGLLMEGRFHSKPLAGRSMSEMAMLRQPSMVGGAFHHFEVAITLDAHGLPVPLLES